MVPSGGSFAELNAFTRKRSREDMQLERPASVSVDDENMLMLANEGQGSPQSWESQRIAQLSHLGIARAERLLRRSVWPGAH